MALQFQPPPDWLMQEYMNRKNPVQQGLDSALQISQLYAQQKQQQSTNALAQQDRDIKMAQGLSDGGQDFSNNLKQIQDARTPVQGTSLIDRAKAFFTGSNAGKSPDATTPAPANYFPAASPAVSPGLMQNTQAMAGMATPSADFQPPIPSTGTVPSKPTPPALGSDPAIEEFTRIGAAEYQKLHGTKGMAKVKDALAIEKGLQDNKKGPLKTVTKKQALENKVFDPTKEMIVDPAQESQGETKAERLSSSLRKELTGSKSYERFTSLKAAADNIENAAKDPGAFGDLSTVFDYMKALDPTSVVREGEQESFRKTGSFTQSMANTMNKLVSGQQITPEQRAEILKYTKSRVKTAHGIYKSLSAPTLRQAERLKIDPLEVDPYYDYKTDDEGSTGPHGASVSQNGHTYNWNPSTGQYE